MYGGHDSIRNYEPRQIRKKAAINSGLCGYMFSIERSYPYFEVIKVQYTSLYREFRPLTFDEMVGQDAITTTLKNQIMSGRVGHAYLFNGGRGTGKTSAAKILARAVNCLHTKNGNPCNECEICRGIMDGSLTDVVEMDAASNNSVEDIRSIRDAVNFLPTVAKYRVYIIDEVHMLSTGAFNALLKTLEEPPEHVKFILATTEPQKLPATILSRCQRYDFKKIGVENITKRLKIITDQIGVKIEDEALQLIGNISDGAMRDSISLLERCIQDGEETITATKIREIIGIPKIESILFLLESIIEYNVENAIKIEKTILEEGKDLSYFIWETIKCLNDMLLWKVCGELQVYSQENEDKMKVLAGKMSKERILKMMDDFSKLDNDIKWSTQKTILFQTGILRMCIQEDDSSLEARVEKLEQKVEKAVIATQKMNTKSDVKIAVEPVSNKKVQNTGISKIVAPTSKANTVSTQYWGKVLDQIKTKGKIMIYTNLLNTKAVEKNNDTLEIEFANHMTSFGKTVLNNRENIDFIAKTVEAVAGKNLKIQYKEKGKTEENNDNLDHLNSLGIPIHIIEE